MEDGRGKMEAISCTWLRWEMEEGRWKQKRLTFVAKGGGLFRHGMKHGKDFFVILEEFFVSLFFDIATGQGEFEPGLGFGGFLTGIRQLIYEDGFLSSLAPGLGKVGTNRHRGSTDLIG